MISDERIAAGLNRLESGKLSDSDIDNLIGSFRILLGPLEDKYGYDLLADLSSIDDTDNSRQKAAKLAGCVLILYGEDFDTDTIDSTLISNANIYRNLISIFAFSLIHKIPAELMESEAYRRYFLGGIGYSTSFNSRASL